MRNSEPGRVTVVWRLLVSGWQIVREFKNEGWSGTRTDRPALKQLMQEAAIRKFDVVLCWKLERFGRSLIDCLCAIQQLKLAGVRFLAITQGIDTDESNPAAKFQLQVLGAAAEFERELLFWGQCQERLAAFQMC